jgi:hypothetical protein
MGSRCSPREDHVWTGGQKVFKSLSVATLRANREPPVMGFQLTRREKATMLAANNYQRYEHQTGSSRPLAS